MDGRLSSSANRLRAVHGRAAQDHRRDASRIGDVVQRVCVEHDEVGALAGLKRSGIGKPQKLCAAMEIQYNARKWS